MDAYKSSKDDFASASPAQRWAKFKWWFIILIILGIVALITVWLLSADTAIYQIKKSSMSTEISNVYIFAQQTSGNSLKENIPISLIVIGVFGILGIVYLASIYKLLFSKNSAQVDKAAELVKTLTGFFIGAATGILA